jgi:hypothetical protein
VPDSPSPAPEAPKVPAPVRSVERWAARKNTPALWVRATCVAQRWTDPRSVVIDEATYDAAIHAARTVECR